MRRVYLQWAKISLSNTTVLKYMQELGLRSTVTPKKPAYKKGECYKKFENHLNREFQAEKPNEKWCTDFTYIYMEDGRKRYNCSIIDLYDRSVVETLNSNHIDADLAVQTLKAALKRPHYPKNLMLHSDQGSQYTSRAFTDYCKKEGFPCSKSWRMTRFSLFFTLWVLVSEKCISTKYLVLSIFCCKQGVNRPVVLV